jgi:hypothetical protein
LFVADLTRIHDFIWQLETMQGTWHVLDVLDLGQRLLENTEQHTRVHAVEIEHAHQAQLMIDVGQHAE